MGLDGSTASLRAFDWAVDEAALHGIPLHLLHAATGEQEPSDVISAASARAGARAASVRLSSEVTHADAAAALIGEGRNAFALIVGDRGFGDLSGMLLGSVSLAVAARADCPVVVVRGGPEQRAGQFGCVVVGVEDGEGSNTAVEFAVREAHVRRCRLVGVHAFSTPTGHRCPAAARASGAATGFDQLRVAALRVVSCRSRSPEVRPHRRDGEPPRAHRAACQWSGDLRPCARASRPFDHGSTAVASCQPGRGLATGSMPLRASSL
ncbi:universal stress protein [Streptomyces sp. NPDC015139]|uniref:universal stress protein n=1 Tax=Streptomyces sp. NPDC015139 TaxID=3364942 RepID=UPI0036FBD6C5